MSPKEFKECFLPHYQKLYRIAYRMVGKSDIAENMVQDTYTKLWDKCATIENVVSGEAYCTIVLKNICLDYLHRQCKEAEIDNMIEPTVIDSDCSADERLEYKDSLNNVMRIMKQLPQQQQQVLRLRSINDCSITEIEQMTGLSNINVRTLLSRARKRLRELYVKQNQYCERNETR